jgi:kumamolisin
MGIFVTVTLFSSLQAWGVSTVVLSNSIKPVAGATSTGAVNTRSPYVSRQTLTSSETNAPIIFEVALKMRNFSELQSRVSRGERIPFQEMAAKYEPLASNYQGVVTWLKGEGFTIVRTDSHHMAVFVQGKVGKVAQALKVNFARVTSEGKEYTSAVTAPSVPGDISPLLIGINGLQPHLLAHKHLMKQQAQPNAATGSASYLPSQIAQAYSATGLYNSNVEGGGQTIAIVIDTFPSTTDLLLFWKNCHVNQSISNIQFVQVIPGSLPAPSGEETLDVEWSSAIAPQAHIRVYAEKALSSTDLDLAYQQVIDDVTNHPGLGIHQMSMSYGEGETYYMPSSLMDTDDAKFALLAAAGVTVFASSGDGGNSPGSSGVAGDESGAVQVEFPASDPNVTGVGGTTLMLDANNNVSSETVWNNSSGASGGGTSGHFTRPSWQTGNGVPAGTMREVPDVACSADPNYGAITYLDGKEAIYGGTSWASPTWAGFCALINQARANVGLSSLGTLGPYIYSPAILGTASYATDFRDITVGNNSSNGATSFNAGAGYDVASGIGVPLAQSLAETLAGSSTLSGLQMPPAMQTVLPGQNATITAAVGGASATYQWQQMTVGTTTWSSLSDTGSYSGSETATLTVTNASTAMSGDEFQCLVTFSNNVTITSTPSTLIVDTPLVISPLAGSTGVASLKNGSGTSANFSVPSGIAIDGSGNLYIADFSNNAIREVTPGGSVTTPYGSGISVFDQPNGVAFDGAGDLYVADAGNNLIQKVSSGAVSTFAGSGGQFNAPTGVAVDGSGNVYVADSGNDVIREISPGGNVTTFAGQVGTAGYTDGPAGQALFDAPNGLALDTAGNVYVADTGNCEVRKITPGGVVSTIAGQPATGGYLDGPGTSALFNSPAGVFVDGSGNIFVADCLFPDVSSNATGNNLLRRISPAGVVSTLAGQPGNEGSANGTGTVAEFDSVQAVAMNSTGTFYLADAFNQTIRMGVQPSTISVAATQPEATVFGPTPGQFTVSRTGDAFGSLAVNYSLGGTGINGTDYTALPDTVTIASGSSSAAVTVNPLSDPQATSSPTVLLTLNSAPNATVGSPGSATLTIEELTPYQSWKTSEFGANATNSTIAGDAADPNNNGVPNLLEYAFNSNPLQTGTEPLPVVSMVQSGGQTYLAITYTQLNTDPNLTYTVQVTGDLTQQTDQWHSGSTYTTVVVPPVSTGNTSQVTVRDNTPITPGIKRFIRVQVSGN